MTTISYTIIKEHPPIWADIVRVFPHVANAAVLFSWGDLIYNPAGFDIPPALIAHELVHGARQGDNEDLVRMWWEHYLVDRDFRLREELPAHAAELRWYSGNGNRHDRRGALDVTARRLSSPLYGQLVTKDAAKRLLRDAVKCL